MNSIFRQALKGLTEAGAYASPVADLLPATLRDEFDRDTAALAAALGDSDGLFVSTRYASIFSFALCPDLMELVEAYLECPPALTAAHVRRDIGPKVPEDLRCWHLDYEDDRMIRMIIYLQDVDIHTGPFEYIPRHLTSQCEHLRARSTGDPRTNPNYQAVGDDEMRKAVPEAEWVACTGPRHTAVIADPAAVFHRTKPHRRERVTLTLTYTSRSPRFPAIAPTPGEVSYLSDQQRAWLYVENPD